MIVATLDSVKVKLQNLISKANAKTGRNDATLTPAVNALISGYGAGSGDITPTGSISITENGTYDVTDKASAVVDVPQNVVVRTFSVGEDLGGSVQFTTPIITADPFIVANYNKPNLSITLLPQTAFTADQYFMPFVWQSNRAMFSAKSTYYGITGLSSGASAAPTGVYTTVPLTSRTYTGLGLQVFSNGNINLCGGTTHATNLRKFKAGTYLLVLTCME